MVTDWQLGWVCAVVGICCTAVLVIAALLTIHNGR